MAEERIVDFQEWKTLEGQISMGDVMKNQSKMAVMIRRIFPSQFRNSQYIGLQMGGELDGSVIVSAPRTFSVKCGESPVGQTGGDGGKDATNGVASIISAENGDIVLHAPHGRIRIVARDIDLVSTGDGTETGFINVSANGGMVGNVNEYKMEAKGACSMSGERGVDINSSGRIKMDCGTYKLTETPDIALTGGFESVLAGNMGPFQFAQGLRKLINSLPI